MDITSYKHNYNMSPKQFADNFKIRTIIESLKHSIEQCYYDFHFRDENNYLFRENNSLVNGKTTSQVDKWSVY